MTAQNHTQSCASRRAALDTPFDLESFARFLRRRFPADTAYAAEAATGIKWQTVRNWLDGRAAPSAPHLLQLTDALGPDVLVAAWGARLPGWLDSARADAELAALEAERLRLDARMADLKARMEGRP